MAIEPLKLTALALIARRAWVAKRLMAIEPLKLHGTDPFSACQFVRVAKRLMAIEPLKLRLVAVRTLPTRCCKEAYGD